MIHFVFGNQSATIKTRIKKIVKASLDFVDEINYAKFDGNMTLVQDWVDEATFMPLGYDRKVVSVENCYFLLKPKPRNKIESDQKYEKLIEYINHPNDATELIISVVSSSLDERNEIVKLLKEKAKVAEIVDPDKKTWKEYVKMYCKDTLKMNIDFDALTELTDRTAVDVAFLQNNAKKLALYKDHITYDDVCLMVQRPLEDNAFQLFNFLIQKRNNDAISLYRDLRVGNVEPVTLISMLANQFRLLNQVQFLSRNGMTADEIAKELKIKPIRATILKKQVYIISEKKIHKVLDELYNLDYEIKSGQVDRFYTFEMFLINFIVE